MFQPPAHEDNSDVFPRSGTLPGPQTTRLEPDPYQFHSPSPVPRGPSQNSRFESGRYSTPVVDPYRVPYEGT